jgi:hypothetical protein
MKRISMLLFLATTAFVVVACSGGSATIEPTQSNEIVEIPTTPKDSIIGNDSVTVSLDSILIE